MRSIVALLVVALVAHFAAAQNSSPWAGTWSNNAFGGVLYVCVNGNTLSATFSNLGVLEGTISANGRNVNGTWAIAGYTDNSSGYFQWTLGPTNTTFSGTYYVTEYPCLVYTWSPTGTDALINTNSNPNQCVPLTPSGTGNVQAGEYTLTTGSSQALTLCLDGANNTYYGTFVGSTTAYVSGNVLFNGRVLQGSFVGPVSGIELYLLTGANTLVRIYVPYYSYAQAVPYQYLVGPFNATTLGLTSSTNSDNDLGCLAARASYPTWSGTFDDTDFGYGRSFFCQAGNQVWGVYSEVGFFQGTVESNSSILTGTFYDAGDTVSPPGYGPFELIMAPDGNSFIGNWSFEYTNNTYSWDDVRISPNTPTTDQCATPTTSGLTLAGSWTYELSVYNSITLNLCFNNDSTRYSYSYSSTDNTLQGYGQGFIQINGTALRGQWYTPTAEGIEYWIAILDGNTAINSVWPFIDLQTVQYFPCVGPIVNNWFLMHGVVNFTRIASSFVTLDQCNANAYLNVPHSIPSPIPAANYTNTPKPSKSALPEHTSYTYFNSASSMGVATLVMALFVLVLFFI